MLLPSVSRQVYAQLFNCPIVLDGPSVAQYWMTVSNAIYENISSVIAESERSWQVCFTVLEPCTME